jgi:hypothetical protein
MRDCKLQSGAEVYLSSEDRSEIESSNLFPCLLGILSFVLPCLLENLLVSGGAGGRREKGLGLSGPFRRPFNPVPSTPPAWDGLCALAPFLHRTPSSTPEAALAQRKE